MAAARLVLGSAILGLFCTGFPRSVLTSASTNRCDSPPCTCDQYGRLTCDCKDDGEELILSAEGAKRLSPHTSRIFVSNCRSVTIANSSLSMMEGLRSVDLMNIANLTLKQYSFELSPRTSDTRISVKNSSVDVLPSSVFRGNVDTISFEGVRIGQMRSFAFANINKTERILLDGCRVESLEAQAFKKFDVRYLHVVGGSLGEQVPSKAMNDIEVSDKFMLDGVRMGKVRSSAFIMKRPRTVAIQNCAIDNLESEAFDISTRGTVIIKNNTLGSVGFGVFLGIRAEREGKPSGGVAGAPGQPPPPYDLFFEDNSLTNFEEGSLVFDRASFRPHLDNVLVGRPCDCLQIPVWKSNILNHSNVYNRLYASGLTFASGSLSQDEASDGAETFLCLDADESPISFTEFESRSCVLSRSMLILGLALGGLLLLLLIAAFLVIHCCRRKRRRNNRKRWISVPTSAPDVVSKKNGVIGKDSSTSGGVPVDSRITMVVPDGRLYRETEFHVIVEKAEPLTTEL